MVVKRRRDVEDAIESRYVTFCGRYACSLLCCVVFNNCQTFLSIHYTLYSVFYFSIKDSMMVNAILQINPETRSKFCFEKSFAEKV